MSVDIDEQPTLAETPTVYPQDEFQQDEFLTALAPTTPPLPSRWVIHTGTPQDSASDLIHVVLLQCPTLPRALYAGGLRRIELPLDCWHMLPIAQDRAIVLKTLSTLDEPIRLWLGVEDAIAGDTVIADLGAA